MAKIANKQRMHNNDACNNIQDATVLTSLNSINQTLLVNKSDVTICGCFVFGSCAYIEKSGGQYKQGNR